MRYLRLFLGLAALSWTPTLLAQIPRNATEALTQHQWRWSGRRFQNKPIVFSSDGSAKLEWGSKPDEFHIFRWNTNADPTKVNITLDTGYYMEMQFDREFTRLGCETNMDTVAVRIIPSVAKPAISPAPQALPNVIPAKANPAPAPTPQALADLTQRLQNTQWKFVHKQDYLQTGGATIIKDGAWMAIRLRSNGQYTAWHHDKIAHEAKWEAVDANLIRLQDCGPDKRVGLLLKLDAGLTSFSAQNDENVSGTLMNKLGPVNKLVGRWHWNGPGTVHFREDGVCFAEWPNGESGIWRPVGNDRYEVSWASGKYFEKVRMKSGDKELTCERKDGSKFGAHRVIPK